MSTPERFVPSYVPDYAENDHEPSAASPGFGGRIIFIEHLRGGVQIAWYALYAFDDGGSLDWRQVSFEVQAGDQVRVRPRFNARTPPDGEYDGTRSTFGLREHYTATEGLRHYALWERYVQIS